MDVQANKFNTSLTLRQRNVDRIRMATIHVYIFPIVLPQNSAQHECEFDDWSPDCFRQWRTTHLSDLM